VDSEVTGLYIFEGKNRPFIPYEVILFYHKSLSLTIMIHLVDPAKIK